jgi:hypothetical protein
MKKWITLAIALFFTLSVTPAVFGESLAPKGKTGEQTLIAKAKKKSKKKKKKKKKVQASLPIASVHQFGHTKG